MTRPRALQKALHAIAQVPKSTARIKCISHAFRPSDCRWASSSSLHSVDPKEVNHFDDLAPDWWNPQGTSRLLHLMNPLRHQFISNCTKHHLRANQTLRYLDIGCGAGIFAESAARLPHVQKVSAIDPSWELIKIARKHAQKDPLLCLRDRLTYEHRSLDEVTPPSIPGDCYDVVSLFEVIEHVENPSALLREAARFVKPDGWLILSTIARSWTSWVTTKLAAEDIFRVVPRGTHTWSKYINPHELHAYISEIPDWGVHGPLITQGVIYIPAIGWKFVKGSQTLGNYFFAAQRRSHN